MKRARLRIRPMLVVALAAVAAFTTASHGTETRSVAFDPAQTPPPRSEPLLIGANVHYGLRRILGYDSVETGNEQLRSIRARSFRDYLPWSSYSFKGTDAKLTYSQRLMTQFLPQTPLRPLINVGSQNSSVPGGMPPISDEGMVFFRSYLTQAVEDTRRYDPIYEVWNEWNLFIDDGVKRARLKGGGPEADPRAAVHYLRVAKAAIEAIRAVSPAAPILVGAVGDDTDWLWTKAALEGGMMDGADGLSVHLYNHCLRPNARTAREMVDRVSALQAMARDIRKVETPIYVTEYGWTTGGECAVPLDDAAFNFAQFILQIAPNEGVKGIWMHELKNISPDPDDMESNFGLFTYDDKPKPAACFVAEASKIVEEADYVDVRQPFPDVFAVRAKTGDRQKIILFTSTRSVSAQFELSDADAAGTLMCGSGTARIDPRGALGPQPLVFDFDAAEAVEVEVIR